MGKLPVSARARSKAHWAFAVSHRSTKFKEENYRHKKWVSYLYRTAQPCTLASFPTWGS